jgi:hypothetical protein
MLEAALIPEKTAITAKGDSPAVDVSTVTNRVFLIALNIASVLEQESFELTIFGSADGQAWAPKPLLTFPQKFYPGLSPMLLDLKEKPDIKIVRAHWEVNRWGRGPEAPMFEVGVWLKEVPAEVLQSSGKNKR